MMNDESVFQEALNDFNAAIASALPEIVEAARIACGLRAAMFASRYVKPKENQVLYNQIYNIFWNYFFPISPLPKKG